MKVKKIKLNKSDDFYKVFKIFSLLNKMLFYSLRIK